MTTQEIALEQPLKPLTRMNVTQYDNIWKRASPLLKESEFGRGKCSFSPPLKHITVQSTQELLENFDPLDVLDSASERSVSSNDTMIMMTTEEERRNSERIKNSLLDHQFRKTLGNTEPIQFKIGDSNAMQRRSVPNNYVSCHQMLDNAKQYREKFVVSGDDGYCTDSRSNTTAFISSPLSSSLSSLSTSEGSPLNSGGISNSSVINYDCNSASSMQRGPIQKGPNLHINSRPAGLKHGGPAVKRRDVPAEALENPSSLEDRLRALTTIEEEETGGYPGSFGARDGHPMIPSQRDARYGKRTVENPNFGTASNYEATAGVTGYFRAVPVTVMGTEPAVDLNLQSRPGIDTTSTRDHTANSFRPPGSRLGDFQPPSQHVNGDGWKDYTRFFEKDCEIPIHNIDPARRGKFTNSTADNVPDMDINRQIGTGSPAVSKKNRFSFNCDGDRMVLAPNTTEPALNDIEHGHQGNAHHTAQSGGHIRSDTISGLSHSSGGRFHQGTRQNHVMSSMPDLRSQDPSWVPGHRQSPYPGPSYTHFAPNQQQRYEQQQAEQHTHVHPQYMQQKQRQQQQHQQHSSLPHAVSEHYLNNPSHYGSPQHTFDPSNPSHDYGATPTGLAESYPEVVLRRSHLTASARAAPNRPDRYSWQAGSTYDHQQQPDRHAGTERVSLDLGNIPQLQKQIRATSELCLQASRRHVFASSADIYKLFSGQKKPHMPPSSNAGSFGDDSRGQSHRHSFHAMPASMMAGLNQATSSSQPSQDSPRTKPKLRIAMPSASATTVWSPGPVRGDHKINIPPEAWTSVTSLPASAASETERYSQPMSAHAELDRLSYHRPASASADLTLDRPQFQRQSSGYSSETELQQIESNAKAAKKLHKRQGKQHQHESPAQEFIPLNRSIDHESTTGTDTADDNGDNEPVYVNQSMLTRARTFEALNNPSNSDWGTPVSSVVTQRPESMHTSSMPGQNNTDLTNMYPTPLPSSYPNTSMSLSGYTHPSHQPSSNSNNINNQGKTNGSSTYPEHLITQKQVINFNSKPITITTHIPSSTYLYPDPTYNSNTNRHVNNNNPSSGAFSSENNALSNENFQNRPDQLSRDFYSPSRRDQYPSIHPYHQGSQSLQQSSQPLPYGGQMACKPHRSNSNTSNNSVPLSPVEIAQILDVPFETNIISDEQGDRLSTLV